jgi:hypothetical protein
MEIPKIEFKTLKEIKKFLELNKTDLANYYVKLMKKEYNENNRKRTRIILL